MSPAHDTDEATYREQVYEAFADRELNANAAIREALVAGTERLGADIGFFTRIADGTQVIVESVGDHQKIQTGETCPLEDAYCRQTIQLDGLLSVQDAEASGEISARAYETFELGTYIGAKVLVEGDVYGTVCFAESETREAPFTEADELFVELTARLTGQALERQAYEQELEARNERLRTEMERFQGIAETSFDVLFRVDTDWTISYVSEAVERVLGYDRETIVGQTFNDLLAEGSIQPAESAFKSVLDGESVEFLELTFRNATGEDGLMEINARPITDDNGTVTGVQGVARDVTLRRQRERRLRLRTRAIDEANVGITISDACREGNPIVYANDAFEEVTGYPPEDVLGSDYAFLHGPATDEETLATLAEHIGANEPVTVEVVNYRRDGVPFWNRLTITPVEDDHGSVTHFLGFQEDVTQRKRMEHLLERLNHVLRHTLRNDMTVLLGHSERLETGAEETAVAGTIEETVEQLIDLADAARRLEQVANLPVDPEPLDPETLIEDAVEEFETAYPEATIECRPESDRGIYAGAELQIAVEELVENALVHDATPETTITVEANAVEDRVELTVTDDGPGIPETEAQVIETGEETPLTHGRGLGLWLVNWVVTRYGGSFQIRAGDGNPPGTIATMTLPAVEPGADESELSVRPTTLFH